MPHIRNFLIGIVVLAACTTEPDKRPDLSPAVCQESCEKPADCAKGSTCCTEPDKCGADHRCVACTASDQCEGGVCLLGACVECEKDANCKGNENGSHCSPENTCVACASDTQCKGNAGGERCSSTYVCSCAQDKDCKQPGLGLCRDEGCVCSDDTGCPDGASTCELGVCISTAVACAKDAECLTGKSICLAGGTPAASCGCKDDSECGTTDEEPPHCAKGTGACVTCVDDAQCGKGGKCLSPGTPEASCGCIKNADCAAPTPICNTETGLCQECLEGKDCTPQGLGSRCTPEGLCSCAAASECRADGTTPKPKWVCE